MGSCKKDGDDMLKTAMFFGAAAYIGRHMDDETGDNDSANDSVTSDDYDSIDDFDSFDDFGGD